jgi:S-DNA-T family DNA segregation ATPase FtsK/SpoIIIE
MSQTDSRTILDTGGADKLLGKGDMLYFPSGIPKPIRVQGCFCSTKEIESVVRFINEQYEAEYSDEILSEIEKNIPVSKGNKNDSSVDMIPAGNDEMLIERAIDIVVEMGQASTSSLQRKLKLGYARAARIVDELEEMGIVGASEGAKPRKVLMSKSEWAERKIRMKDGQE